MASRALPDLIARIRVDSVGVDAAMAGLVSSFGKTQVAMAGVAAGIGIIIVGAKSMLTIWRDQEKANADLAQAVAVYGNHLAYNQKWLETYIKTNASYISNQAEVVDNYAKLIRSGLDLRETQRVLNDAVDLSALKSISLSDAVDVLNAAEHGRMRGLIDLGITTTKYTDANGNLIKAQHNVAQTMAEVDARLKHGRDTLDSTSQASNRLQNHWQDLASKGGPVIETLLDTVIGLLNNAYDALDRIGKDDALWSSIDQRLVTWAGQIRQFFQDSGLANLIGSSVADFLVWMLDIPSGTKVHVNNPPTTLQPGQKYNPQRAAAGFNGMVTHPTLFMAGEAGPEHVKVTPGGGSNGGSGVTVNVYGYVGDNRQLALVIREELRRLDREQR